MKATMTAQRNGDTSVFVGRAAGACTRICFGRAGRRRSVRGGALHLFGPDQVVGYLIVGEGAERCYVFRTGVAGVDQDAELATRLVGVSPEVRVLIAAVGRNRCSRIGRLLKTLERVQAPATKLTDAFFMRAAAARDRYMTLEQTIIGLLRDEVVPDVDSSLARGRGRALERLR